MRRLSRLTSLGLSMAVLLGFSGLISLPAAADELADMESFQAEAVDLTPQDAGRPAGDGDNAVDTESVAVDRGARIALELSHALGSAQAQDMRGFEESLYQGKWYMPKKEQIRKCIMDREANHRYRAVSAGGVYRGAYQMNRGLARGASFMMQKEVKKNMPQALPQVKQLRKIPTQQWSRYWQDRAFWTIWRHGKGKHHWRTSHRPCF